MRTTLLILLWFGLTACTTLRRSTESGYGQNEAGYRPNYDGSLEANLENSDQEVPDFNLTDEEKKGYDQRLFRIGLEKRIMDPEEKRQYSQYKSLMNEEERIQFLQLPDIYARDRWLDENGFATPEKRHSRQIASIIEKNDIALGMTRLAVKDSWGDPDVVEIAGNPSIGNERWKFVESIGSPDGFKVEERIVYFEKGSVAGWETKK